MNNELGSIEDKIVKRGKNRGGRAERRWRARDAGRHGRSRAANIALGSRGSRVDPRGPDTSPGKRASAVIARAIRGDKKPMGTSLKHVGRLVKIDQRVCLPGAHLVDHQLGRGETHASQHADDVLDEPVVEHRLGQLEMPKVPRRVRAVHPVRLARHRAVHRAHPRVAQAAALGPALLVGLRRVDLAHRHLPL